MTKLYFLFILIFAASFSFAQEESGTTWWNPAESEFPVISGQAWPGEVSSLYHRLPARAEADVRKAVWNLSKQAAGLSIRFWSNAERIQIKYKLKGNISMPHMPATGVSGLDLYGKSYDGEWLRCWASYDIGSSSNYAFTIDSDSDTYKTHGREYQLFLPLYNEVEVLEIGINEGSFLNPLPIRKEKPVVAYGTSICQGACASRPGMAWTSILERRLERPVINLGFSGNGRLEPELIDLMCEIDAKLYILDCLPNLSPTRDDIYKLTVSAVRKLKEKRPDAAVLLTAHIGYADKWTNHKGRTKVVELNKALDSAYNALITAGYAEVYLLAYDDLAYNKDMYVDRIHPNDYGMVQYADVYEHFIREILDAPSGSLSTTRPCTQSRDIAVYRWEERHQEILELNQAQAPEICLFGNSIVNFWGGEPESSIARGQDSWEQIMEPMGVRNFGFGWDRIENVLWRVYHDELDGFEAKQIVLMIGTNNLHLNDEAEIIQGLETLIKAIRTRQPESRILMIGILPRRGKEAVVEQLNERISQLSSLDAVDFRTIGRQLLKEDGSLDESLFTDGLHPNRKGYRILAEEMKELILDAAN